jgi:hypothetical protein
LVLEARQSSTIRIGTIFIDGTDHVDTDAICVYLCSSVALLTSIQSFDHPYQQDLIDCTAFIDLPAIRVLHVHQ